MKISELIKELTEIENRDDDLDVMAERGIYCDDSMVCDIEHAESKPGEYCEITFTAHRPHWRENEKLLDQ